jgi:hypothetical protein
LGELVSKIEILAIIPEEPPLEYFLGWVAGMKKAAPKISKGLRKVLASLKEYTKTIPKPGIVEMKKWLRPGYRTKAGRTDQEVIKLAEARSLESYHKFKKKIKRLFKKRWGKEAKCFLDTIDYRAYQACLRVSQLSLPFTGYRDRIRGLASFATRWLLGDQTVKYLVIDQDRPLKGGPINIISNRQVRQFRQKFCYRIQQAGSPIVKSRKFNQYDPAVIRAENDLTNQLVNQFIRPDIVPFSTGGPSHLDFVVIDEKLYLEVQVSTNDRG